MSRRVVVTGLGLLTPLACGVEESWQALIAGQSGAGPITRFDPARLPCRIACQVPEDGPQAFRAQDWVSTKERRRLDRFSLYAVIAARQALEHAGWKPQTPQDQAATGVAIGSGIGGLAAIEDAVIATRGQKPISPFFLPKALANMAAGNVSIRFGLKGPNISPVTACAASSHAIGDAARLIMSGDAEVMVAGGAESAITETCVGGFAACRALSTRFNDDPRRASRPYDKDRDGFVIGEGAGIVVLESWEHARDRGAKIHAQIAGYGLSGDAHHITAPARDGDGALRAMQAALKHARLKPAQIDYINAHGTSTPLGDEIELTAISRLINGEDTGGLNQTLTVSSTKSAIGHLLGAAGAVEAIFSILAMRDGIAPPTLNLDNPDVETGIDLAPKTARRKRIDTAMSNSFGFGGTNACLVFTKPD